MKGSTDMEEELEYRFRVLPAEGGFVSAESEKGFLVLASHPLSEIEPAYSLACAHFGFDILEAFAISPETPLDTFSAEKLVAQGFAVDDDFSNFFELWDTEQDLVCNEEDVVRIVMFMVQKQLSNLDFKVPYETARTDCKG